MFRSILSIFGIIAAVIGFYFVLNTIEIHASDQEDALSSLERGRELPSS